MKHSKAYVRLLLKEKDREESRENWNDLVWEMMWFADDVDEMADLLEMWED